MEKKWDCLQTNNHCDKTKLHCWRENCTVYFSITRPVNVRSFFTNYVVLFANQAKLYARKCSSFVAIRADCAHMHTSRTNDPLEDASNLSPISCSFPQHLSSACHRAVQKWIYALKLFAYLQTVVLLGNRASDTLVRIYDSSCKTLFSTHRTKNVLSRHRIRSIDCR